MPFCPICKNEYTEGITICSDCKVPLVDALAHSDELCCLTLTNEAVFNKFIKYLDYSRLTYSTECPEEASIYEIYARASQKKKIAKAWHTFVTMEARGPLGADLLTEEAAFDILRIHVPAELRDELAAEAAAEEAEVSSESEVASATEETLLTSDISADDSAGEAAGQITSGSSLVSDLADSAGEEARQAEEGRRLMQRSTTYESLSRKAEESYGSAILLLLFGVALIGNSVLNLLSVFNHFNTFGSIVLAIFGAALTCSGIYTWKQYRSYSANAASEASSIDALKRWLAATYPSEVLSDMDDAALSVEENELAKMEIVLRASMIQFPELSEEALTEFVDEYFGTV